MTTPRPEDPRTSRRLSVIAVIAAATALALAVAVLVATTLKDSRPAGTPLPTATVTATRPPVTTVPPPPTITPSPVPTPTPSRRVFRYQAVWPFGSEQDAAVWQQAYRKSGSQPWHLDAAQTALSFTMGFLSFDEVNTVVSRTVRGDDATVAVGYRTGTTTPSVAAVLHLRRIGQGEDAPWEVVGSRDTSLTLDRPGYGSFAGSPLRVGGRITGVDEAIRIEVRQHSSNTVLGAYCCVPAGGEHTPWSASVFFRGATDDVLVIVASTGGHYQAVEKFAITAVRPRGGV
ncbi:hypothetical protein [Kribbella ginsengisoli]|uniref:Uncharacterized protein n=1 Tax=Kribbella ginsengisoli TaxID=363865 RepID=A0ABP6Z1S8_9ACTN